jgi:two-component system chemotaxis response regulator CheB
MDGPARSLVVVGASAGGIEALRALAADLPADLDAAVAVVLHLPAGATSRLPEILERAGALPAKQAQDGDALLPGRIVAAPPDRHLLVRRDRCAVVRGPRENGLRPSIDVLFRSAAASFGPRTVGVILSGARDDGVAGASAVGRRGGCVFVEDPGDASFPDMPLATVSRDRPDRVLPLAELGDAVAAEVTRLSAEEPMRENGSGEMALETEYAILEAGAVGRGGPPGAPSPFACPECGGVLWELDDTQLPRYRCRVGHAYSAESALDGQGAAVENALWAALRALQERASLAERIAERMSRTRSEYSRMRFEELGRDAREQAETIRRVLVGLDVDVD